MMRRVLRSDPMFPTKYKYGWDYLTASFFCHEYARDGELCGHQLLYRWHKHSAGFATMEAICANADNHMPRDPEHEELERRFLYGEDAA